MKRRNFIQAAIAATTVLATSSFAALRTIAPPKVFRVRCGSVDSAHIQFRATPMPHVVFGGNGVAMDEAAINALRELREKFPDYPILPKWTAEDILFDLYAHLADCWYDIECHRRNRLFRLGNPLDHV